jgi:hypothetical protein
MKRTLSAGLNELEELETSSNREEFSVAVIGAGVGGLAAAVALRNVGIKCSVFERDHSLLSRREGYGLTLTNNPKGPLATLGVLEDCIKTDCPSYCHWVFKPDGAILGYYGRAFKDNSAPDIAQVTNNHLSRGNLRVPRQDLREILMKKLDPATVMWNMKLNHIDDSEEDGVTLTFANGFVGKFHLVVGADGVNSMVRKCRDSALLGNSNPEITCLKFIGVTVILGLSTSRHPLLSNKGFYVLDGTHRLFTMPFRETSETGAGAKSYLTMWQLSFSGLCEGEALALKNSSPQTILLEARRRTAGWFAAVVDLLVQSSPDDVWATPLYDRDQPVLVPRSR